MNRLKQLREENGWTQLQLSEKLDCAMSSVAMYENGSRKPSLDVLVKLSEIFNCSIDYILGQSDIRNSEASNNNLIDLAKIGFTKENYNPPTEKQEEAIKTIIETILQDNKKDNNQK